MSVVDLRTPPDDVDHEFHILAATLSRGRRVKNRLATVLMVASFFAAAIPLAAVLFVVISKGIGVIRADWFTEDIPTNIASSALASKFGATPKPVVYGMQPAIIGTLYVVLFASLMALRYELSSPSASAD